MYFFYKNVPTVPMEHKNVPMVCMSARKSHNT